MSAAVFTISRPDLIDAHLLEAAMEGASGVLNIDGHAVIGRIDMADGFGEIAFLVEPGAPRVLRDAVLEADYWLEGVRYRFSTRLCTYLTPSRLRLHRPRRVHCFERRVRARESVGPECFCLIGDATIRIADLSEAGARLRLTPELPPMRAGERIEAWVILTSDAPMPVIIEAVHARRGGEVGVHFEQIRVDDRSRITAYLDQLSRQAA